MPNDAKLGLVVGVGLVLLIAVLFFRKEGPASAAPAEPVDQAVVQTKGNEDISPQLFQARPFPLVSPIPSPAPPVSIE